MLPGVDSGVQEDGSPNRQSDPRPTQLEEPAGEALSMINDMIDYMEHIRERPVWQPIPGRPVPGFTRRVLVCRQT
jgi:hypothetical protein